VIYTTGIARHQPDSAERRPFAQLTNPAESEQDCVRSLAAFRLASLSSGGLVMTLFRSVVLILCASFVPVASSQQPASTVQTNWSEFRRPNMKRWNPYEKVLNVKIETDSSCVCGGINFFAILRFKNSVL
jgi:hypothetical protein